jgi:hypothetical protein
MCTGEKKKMFLLYTEPQLFIHKHFNSHSVMNNWMQWESYRAPQNLKCAWITLFQSTCQRTGSCSLTPSRYPRQWPVHLCATWLIQYWLLAVEWLCLVWTLASRVGTRSCDLQQSWCHPLWHCLVQTSSHPSGPCYFTLSSFCLALHSRCVLLWHVAICKITNCI